MAIVAHREKIKRLSDLMARFDPVEDFEIWRWAGISAATNALNATLHHLGLTISGDRNTRDAPPEGRADRPGARKISPSTGSASAPSRATSLTPSFST